MTRQSETEQILCTGRNLYQAVSRGNCMENDGSKGLLEALMPRLWRWADRVMVVVMAIPLSGFVELLSIIFSADHCNRRQGSIALF